VGNCFNFLQQQTRFDKFIEVFDNEGPPEALDMKCPGEVYQPSTRPPPWPLSTKKGFASA
jgi:hypothetical protein